MDYYEVLGIRSSASMVEIELANKGRRSQYHPDRYAASDLETIAWATVKMQEVNEAYAVLTDPESRAEFDRRRESEGGRGKPSNSPPSRPERQSTAAPARETKDVASVLLRPEWDWDYDNIYVRPNIPPKKLAGAISSYANEVSFSDVIVLLDDTVFGGAKEGVIVTKEAVWCKQKLEDPRCMTFVNIQSIEPGTDSRLMINGQEFFKANLVDHLAMLTFSSRLGEVLGNASVAEAPAQESRSHEQGKGGVELLWRVHRAAMAGLNSELDGEGMLVDELIDRQMHAIACEFSSLRAVVDSTSRRPLSSLEADAEVGEVSLMLFLAWHYYSLANLPDDFRESMGDDLIDLSSASDIYKQVFLEAYPYVFNRAMNIDEANVEQLSDIFFHHGAGRSDLSDLMDQMRIPKEVTLRWFGIIDQHTKWWFEEFCKLSIEDDE